MPRRSNRLIYCFWDDRQESFWDYSRRESRQLELMVDLPPLWVDAIIWKRRTLYTYGKRALAKGVKLDGVKPNNFFMRTTSRYNPGPAAGEYALMKHAMAVFITCWEPYVCGVRTKALDALIPDPEPFRAAWMLYVHPSLAGSVVPPDVAVVEAAPDGGLFLAATTRPFKADEVEHFEAAQRIAAAVAHLNVARPAGDAAWPPWTGSYSTNYYEARDRMWLGKTLTKITPDQTLYPDATNPRVVGRVGPPDEAWQNDLDGGVGGQCAWRRPG